MVEDMAAMLVSVHGLGFKEECGELQDIHCRYCGAWLNIRHDGTPYEEHADDCLFFRIEKYLKEIGRI